MVAPVNIGQKATAVPLLVDYAVVAKQLGLDRLRARIARVEAVLEIPEEPAPGFAEPTMPEAPEQPVFEHECVIVHPDIVAALQSADVSTWTDIVKLGSPERAIKLLAAKLQEQGVPAEDAVRLAPVLVRVAHFLHEFEPEPEPPKTTGTRRRRPGS